MKRHFLFALCLCLLIVSFETSMVAQTGRSSGNKPVITNPKIEPPVVIVITNPKTEALRAVNKEIQTLCSDLEKAITGANRAYSKPPFDVLTLAADFQTRCKTDGIVGWTATRNGGYAGDPSNTKNTIVVEFNVTDLTLGDLTSKRGVVTFGVAKDKKIHVYGPTTIGSVEARADNDVTQWWIDLRDEGDLVEQFKKSIQNLVEKLAERSNLD